MATDGSQPIAAVYPFNSPGEAISLGAFEASIGEAEIGQTEFWVSMKRGLRVRWKGNGGTSVPLEPTEMQVSSPIYGSQALAVRITSTEGYGDVVRAELGREDDVVNVVVHWVNLPSIHPSVHLGAEDGQRVARWSVATDDWELILDSRPDLNDTLRRARREDEEYAVTHVGELRRRGGETFSIEEAKAVLFGWQLAMSFALGKWVAPCLPIGFDSAGHRRWEEWASWRCDTMTGYQSWWDTHTGDDLAEFVCRFVSMYLDPKEGPALRHLVMHTIAANHSGTTGEAKVMLAHAGLEYVSWVDLKLSRRMSRRDYKALDVEERLRVLLSEAGIPKHVPPDLTSLHQLASQRGIDGPSAVAWVRNRMAHPKDINEPYRLEGLIWQAAQLLLEYSELLTLKRVGYTGRFMKRYPPGRWDHTSVPVPWIGGDN